MKNIARIATIKLLTVVEILNEFKTGKHCHAKANFCLNIGFGYHRRVEDDTVVEFYLFPFTIVSITTFSIGHAVVNAATTQTTEQ